MDIPGPTIPPLHHAPENPTFRLLYCTTKSWVKLRTEEAIGQIKFRDIRDIFRNKHSPIEVDYVKCWTQSVKGSFDIKVVALWSSRLDDDRLREFTTEGVRA
jgi:hypothetical protein